MRTANPEFGDVATSAPAESRKFGSSCESIKRRLDFVLALVMLLLSFPVILLAMVLVKLTREAFRSTLRSGSGCAGRSSRSTRSEPCIRTTSGTAVRPGASPAIRG